MLVLTSLLIAFLTVGHSVPVFGTNGVLNFIYGAAESQADFVYTNSYPYYAEVESAKDCGAAVISPDFLLTTAKCAQTIKDEAYAFIGGATIGLSKPVLIKRVLLHADYEWPTWYNGIVNDIALVMLSSSLKFSNSIRPIKLPKNGEAPEGFNYTMVFRSGYGEAGLLLREEKNMNVYPAVDCYKQTEFSANHHATSPLTKEEITEMNMASVCAIIRPEDSREVCDSNPGGLLVKQKTLYGLGSYRYKDCKTTGNFLTNVGTYVTWIENVMQKALESPPEKFKSWWGNEGSR